MSPVDVIVLLALGLLVVVGATSGTWTRELQAIRGQLVVVR